MNKENRRWRISGAEDERAVKDFLFREPEKAMFLCANLLRGGIVYEGRTFQGIYGAVFDAEGDVSGVVALNWNGFLMARAPEGVPAPLLREIFCRAQENGIGLSGLMGPDDESEAARLALGIGDDKVSCHKDETLFRLDLSRLILPPHHDDPALRTRKPRTEDLDLLSAWRYAYEVESLGSPASEKTKSGARESAKRQIESGDYWILESDGVPVSFGGFNARFPDIVQLGGIWTPPEHRNRGYARILIAKFLQEARVQGVERAVLFTMTPEAVRAYRALGFEAFGAYRLTFLKEPWSPESPEVSP